MLQLRIRACHVYGRFTAGQPPLAFTPAARSTTRARHAAIALPPATYVHEQREGHRALAGRRALHRAARLNEFFDGDRCADLGIVVQGGHYNASCARSSASAWPTCTAARSVPLYVHERRLPGHRREVLRFCAASARARGRGGAADFVEQNIATSCARAAARPCCTARTCCRWPASTCRTVVRDGLRAFLERYGALLPSGPAVPSGGVARPVFPVAAAPLAEVVHGRPPGFCTGCPERPIFSAMKLVERELGAHHVSADIGCHLFSILPPFNIGNTTMGYGLGHGRRLGVQPARQPFQRNQ
jgi:indolepyruvate ferredoxin oxidoreductase alpha subunit